MRYVSSDEIRSVLGFPMLIAELEAAHRRPKMEVQDAFLGNEGEPVYIRVNGYSHIRFLFTDFFRECFKVVRQRLGVVRKISIRGGIQFCDLLYSQCFQQQRNSNAAC